MELVTLTLGLETSRKDIQVVMKSKDAALLRRAVNTRNIYPHFSDFHPEIIRITSKASS